MHMRLPTVLITSFLLIGLAACEATGARVGLPAALSLTSKVCRSTERAGNPPPITQSQEDSSKLHHHQSIERWKLVDGQTWFKMFPRKGSQTRFSAKVSYDDRVEPSDKFNEMELLDFRVVNPTLSPIEVKVDLNATQLCQAEGLKAAVPFQNGPFLIAVEPLQNADETDVSEHVLVYAPLKLKVKDSDKPIKWYVLLIWHVRSTDACRKLADSSDRDSCLALKDIVDLDPGRYATTGRALFRKVKYPYVESRTLSHNGVIHGVLD
jgi:hypothetical protein